MPLENPRDRIKGKPVGLVRVSGRGKLSEAFDRATIEKRSIKILVICTSGVVVASNDDGRLKWQANWSVQGSRSIGTTHNFVRERQRTEGTSLARMAAS
jgi:hypothetical protein